MGWCGGFPLGDAASMMPMNLRAAHRSEGVIRQQQSRESVVIVLSSTTQNCSGDHQGTGRG